MDFLDPKKKRQHTVRLMVGYILIGIAVGLTSLILLFQTYGYDLNRKTGQVIQNGLVFVASRPVAAKLYLNGVLKDTTSTKLTIAAGQYTIELKQDSYRTWQRTFTLQGGTVKRFVYPVLFPTKLDTKDLQLYSSAPTFANESPDRRWLLVQQPGTSSRFDNFDLNNPTTLPTVITLPDGLLSASTSPDSLKLVEWSTDNRHVLVQHTYGGGIEFIMIDREQPASSYNVNRDFKINPTLVALRNKRFDQLYLYNSAAKTIQSADTRTKQLTQLLTNVINFKAYGANTIIYATDDSQTPGNNTIRLWDGKKSYLQHLYPVSANYILDMATYGDHNYVVVAQVGGNGVYIFKDPLNQAKQVSSPAPAAFTKLRLDQTAFVSFSANAQFIMAQNGPNFSVYDIENNARYAYKLKDVLPGSDQATWMDGNRILVVQNAKTLVLDYDGTNQQTLAPTAAGSLPFFDRNYTNLYTIAPSVQVPDRAALTRTLLTVKQ